MHIFQRSKKRGSCWVLDYYFVEHGVRRRRQESFPTRSVAEKAMAKRVIELSENTFLDKRNRPDPSFDEAVERYVAWARGNKITWKRDTQSLAHWQREFGGRKLSSIRREEVERYKVRRREEVSPRTVNEELSCLRRLFYRMMDWDLAERNPVKGVKFFRQPPGRMAMLSPDERRRLLDACAPQLRPVVLTALDTGMRVGEILRLEWGDVDFAHNDVVVRNSKNGESRRVPMTARLRRVLAGLPRHGGAGRVFFSRRNRPYQSVRNAYEKAVRKAGLGDLHFHDLRHDFASSLRMKGVDLFMIAEFLGHKSLAMTRRYAHVTTEKKREAIRLLDDEDAGGDGPGDAGGDVKGGGDGSADGSADGSGGGGGEGHGEGGRGNGE